MLTKRKIRELRSELTRDAGRAFMEEPIESFSYKLYPVLYNIAVRVLEEILIGDDSDSLVDIKGEINDCVGTHARKLFKALAEKGFNKDFLPPLSDLPEQEEDW